MIVINRLFTNARERCALRSFVLFSLLTTLFFGLLAFPTDAAAIVCAAPGSSGPANISGIVNSYYPGRTSVPAGSTSIPVGSLDFRGSSTPIAAGDLLLVIQMQDADITISNSSSYGGSAPGQGYSSLNSAGAYEYVSAAGPVASGSVPISSPLLNSYHQAAATSTSGQRTFQVIRVPQYSSATLIGTVTAPPWDGTAWNNTAGGVVAIDVAGNLNWNSRAIDVSGLGFRGGAGQSSTSNGTGVTLANIDYMSKVGTGLLTLAAAAGTVPNGTKGEGIAGTPIVVFVPSAPNNNNIAGAAVLTGGTDASSGGYPGGSFGRGAPGNGGGGGTDGKPNNANDENTGGGGGGNYGPGGTGGFGWTPGQPPGSQTGGFGGGTVPNSPAKLFFGGGGGAGSTNNGTVGGSGIYSSGAAGGGIVLVRVKTTTGSGTINANGGTANIQAVPGITPTSGVANDAGGGGGAGGSVLLLVDNTSAATGATINSNGGKGGNNSPGSAGGGACNLGGNDPHGPGGGGSGGYAVVSGFTSLNYAGGTYGLTCASNWTTSDYGSSTSPGGFSQVNLGPADVPGVMASPQCYPRMTVTKSTATPNVNKGGVVSYTITATNQTGYGTAATLAISDILPNSPNFTYAATTSVVLAGGATRPVTTNPSAGATAPSWGSFSVPGGGSVSITYTVNVALATPLATYQNPATVTYDDPTATAVGQKVTPGGTYTAGGTVLGNNYDSASSTGEDVTVRSPATFGKSFSPTSIAVGGTTILTVTVNNNAPISLTSATFIDNYPAGLVNAAVPGATTTCGGGTVSATPGGTSFTLSSATIPASDSCTVQVTLTAPAAGPFINNIPAGALTNAQNITSVTTGSGTLLARPTIAKSFSPTAVPINTNSTLTFTVINTNAVPLTNIAFTDTYTTNMVNATPLTVGGTCTPTVSGTTVAGGSVFNVTGGTVPASSSCTITVLVRSAVVGNYPNTTSGATTTETPLPGSPSNTAALGVGVINITKAFGTSPIASGGTSTVTLTLTNPTGIDQINGSFTDTLTNMQIAAAPVLGGTCTGTTLTPPIAAGQTNLSFSNISMLLANGNRASCTITFPVTSSPGGTNPNTTSGVSTALLPAGPASNTANLVVLATPTISKAYTPTSFQPGGTSTMILTITNPNSIPLSGISFTDSYPSANVKNVSPLTVGGTCSGVVTSAAAGGSTFNVTAGTVPANSSCTITIAVTSNVAGSYPNTTTSGVSSTQTSAVGLGTGPVSNTATLYVVTPPNVINKTFSPATISQGGVSTMTVTLQNTNPIALTNVSFTDSMTNIFISGNQAALGTCTGAGSNNFTNNATNLAFSGLTIAATSSCTVTVQVTSSTSGVNPNQTSGATSSETSLPGTPSPVANLNVLRPPSLAKDFSPGQIIVGGTTTMRFTVTNPNSTPLNNVQFSDTLTSMTVNSTSFAKTCSGAVSFSPALSVGGTQVNPALTSLAANETCTISVTISSSTISPIAGLPNTTSGATSTETPIVGVGATTTLDVLGPVTIAKVFSPTTIQAGDTSTITFTLTNPNSSAMTGASFSDTFPVGMTTTNLAQTFTGGARGTCTGTIPNSKTTTTLDTSVSFAGINIPASGAGGSCTVMVDVTAAAANVYNNTSSGVTTFQVPTAGPGASSPLTVLASPTVAKAFGTPTIVNGGNTTLTLTLTNSNSTGLTGVAISDTYPNNLRNLNTTTSGTCTGTVTASPNGTNPGTLTLAGGSLAANSSCTIIATVTSTVNLASPGYTNTTGGVTSTQTPVAGPTASDSLVVVAAANFLNHTKTFSQATVQAGPAAALLDMVFTITNQSAATVRDVRFNAVDTMPTAGGSQMRLVTPGNACSITAAAPTAASCGFDGVFTVGTIVPNSTGSNLSLNFSTTGNGFQMLANATCTVTCPVTILAATTGGTYTNTSTFLIQTGAAGYTNTSGDTTSVIALKAPTIAKAFSPATIGVNDTSTITFTLTNSAASTVTYTGAIFTDALNANLSIANNQSAGGSCVGAGSNNFTVDQGGTLTFSGLTIPAGGSCSVSVIVKRATAGVVGTYANTTSGVTTNQTATAGTGATSVNLIISGTTLTKAFAPTSVPVGAPSTLTFTITNGAGNPAQTGLQFTDNFPANLVVASPANLTTSCGSGTVTTPTASSVALSGGTLTLGQATCTVTVDVLSNTAGSYPNVAVTNVTGTSTGMTNSTNATLTVNVNPTLTKAFIPTTIGLGTGQKSTLTFTITNPAGAPARTGLTFTDTFANGNLDIATPNGLVNGCGGTNPTATAGASVITAGGAGVNAAAGGATGSTCTISVDVFSNTAATYSNGFAQITAIAAGLNNGVTTQTLEVVRASVDKNFGATSIVSGNSTTLEFTLTNGSGNPAQGPITIGDTLPTNLRFLSATPAVTYSAGCSGPATAAYAAQVLSGLTTIAMTAGTASCTVSIAGLSNAVGQAGICPLAGFTNLGANVTTTNARNIATDVCLSVIQAIPVSKVFAAPKAIASGGANTLTITIGNPTAAAISLTSDFIDNLPAGMTIASVGAGTCAGVTAIVGSSTITKASGTAVQATTGCTIIVNVTSSTPGAATNTILIGAVQTTIGSNTAAATDTLNVYAPPTLTKSFGAASIPSGGNTTLTLTLGNPATNVAAITAVQVDDTFTGGFMLQNIIFTYSPAACGTITKILGGASTASDNNIRFTAASIAPNTTCQVTVNVTSSTPGGPYTNLTLAPTATGPVALTGTTASAQITVAGLPNLLIIKSVTPAWDPVNLAVTPKAIPGAIMLYTIQINNSGPGSVDNNTFEVTDRIPANTSMCVSSTCNNSNPSITDFCSSAPNPACGLSFTLASDVTYSNQAGGGPPYSYTPIPNGLGFDSSVTGLRIRPQGIFSGASGGFDSIYRLLFKVQIK